ncbi:MAG TPA: radical SAM protein [Thermoplasmatales archaeon]|nr:radical SAM protein [Thermoplasmatales archaeon]
MGECMVNKIQVKSVLNKHKKRDSWFLDDYSVNPYSGCSFNCRYCYIKGSKYGEKITKTVSAKINASEILEKQLSRRAKRGEYGIIALSSATEPYMAIEEELGITRELLGIILKYKFPVEIATKSKLVLRDLDLLKEIDKSAILPCDLKPKLKHGTIISFSLSTLDNKLAKVLEPGAPKPIERLETVEKCKDEGFFVGINYIPVLPFISDSKEQLNEMIKVAEEYGADFVFVGGLTLFGNGSAGCKKSYYSFLEKYYPELIPKYESLYRNYFAPSVAYQKRLEKEVKEICKRYRIRNGLL